MLSFDFHGNCFVFSEKSPEKHHLRALYIPCRAILGGSRELSPHWLWFRPERMLCSDEETGTEASLGQRRDWLITSMENRRKCTTVSYNGIKSFNMGMHDNDNKKRQKKSAWGALKGCFTFKKPFLPWHGLNINSERHFTGRPELRFLWGKAQNIRMVECKKVILLASYTVYGFSSLAIVENSQASKYWLVSRSLCLV